MGETKGLIPILSITGSDGTGGSGIQADIKTCSVLGGYALSVVTAVTVQDTHGIQSTHPIAADVIDAQLASIIHDMPPHAVKVGMICDTLSVQRVSSHLHSLNHIVLDTAFISSRGEHIARPDVVSEICSRIMPQCDIVIMKLSEAEMLLATTISNRDAMLRAARMLLERFGMQAIIIQGTHRIAEMRNDLFVHADSDGQHAFFTLPDHTNCNTHGLAGTLSASIATHLASGESMNKAVQHAYSYIQTLTVYSVRSPYGQQSSLLGHGGVTTSITPRQRELYNQFMQHITNNMHEQHDVLFYANMLNISARYLAQITMPITGKSPKQLIAEALIAEASKLLTTTTHSIQEISFQLGFASQVQFAKLFKRVRGVSPSEYRRT